MRTSLGTRLGVNYDALGELVIHVIPAPVSLGIPLDDHLTFQMAVNT